MTLLVCFLFGMQSKHFTIKAMYSRNICGFNINPETTVGPIMTLGAGLVVKKSNL